MANKYWVGGNGVFSDDLNHWALASGGAGGAGNKPGNADIAIFDINSGGGICTIDEAVNILGLDMKVNNTTAILQGNYTITIGTSGAIFTAGNFNGGIKDITNNGIFTINGGTFTSTSATLQSWDTFLISSGTFNHNGGTLELRASASYNFTTGGAIFNNLTFMLTLNGTIKITLIDNFTVNGNIIMGDGASGSNSGTINSSGTTTIYHKGNFNLKDGYFDNDANEIILNLTGDTNQSYNLGKYYWSGFGASITLAKTSSSKLLLENDMDNIYFTGFGKLTIPSGQIFDTQNHEVRFGGDLTNDGTLTVGSSKITMNNNMIVKTGGITIKDLDILISFLTVKFVDDFTISGNLYISGPGNIYSSTTTTRTISLQGNFKDDNCYFGDYTNNLKLKFTGSTDQELYFNNGFWAQLRNTFELAKTGGSKVKLTNTCNGNSGIQQGLTIPSGQIFDLNGFDFEVITTFSNSGTLILKGDETITGLTPTHNVGSRVIYTATTGSRSIKNWTYKNIEIAGAGTFVFDIAKTFTELKSNTANAKLTFGNGLVFAITDLILNGTLGNKIILRSDLSGTAYKLNVSGTQQVSYVDVKDSDASGGITIDGTTACTDSSGNTNWTFAFIPTPPSPIIKQLDVAPNNIKFNSGDTITATGTIELDIATTATNVLVEIRKLSDNSLIETLMNKNYNFGANTPATLNTINGGALISAPIILATDYYILITLSAGTPALYTGIDKTVKGYFVILAAGAMTITNQILSNYAPTQDLIITATCDITGTPDHAVVKMNGKSFTLTLVTGTQYRAIIPAYQIGICTNKTIAFMATNAVGGIDEYAPSNITVTANGNYNIAIIETAIVNLLTTYCPDLKTILNYEPDKIPQLPAVSLWYDGFDQAQTEAVSYTVNHKWIMRLYVRLNDDKISQDDMKALIKSILSAFKADLNLSNTVLKETIPSGTTAAVLDRNNPVLVCSFDLTTMTEED